MLNLGAGSPGSISDDQDLVSDPGDPIHSETLLKELFYKNPVSITEQQSSVMLIHVLAVIEEVYLVV